MKDDRINDMSTVVLTPTHIACDHTVIREIYPHHASTDIGHKKLFLPPSRTFVIGVVGPFEPDEIDTEKTYDAVAKIFAELILYQSMPEFSGGLATLMKSDSLKHFERIFGHSTKIFLVNKEYRFLVYFSQENRHWFSRVCGPYAGIGSGGMIAAGLVMGGMPLTDIWPTLHHIDHLSSAEHTSIPLRSLRKVDMKKKIKKANDLLSEV